MLAAGKHLDSSGRALGDDLDVDTHERLSDELVELKIRKAVIAKEQADARTRVVVDNVATSAAKVMEHVTRTVQEAVHVFKPAV